MNHSFLNHNFEFNCSPLSCQKSTIIFNHFRITILTERLFRIEYDTLNQFEDRPTQIVWNRDMTCSFESIIENQLLSIKTKYWTIQIDKSKPIDEAIFVSSNTNDITWSMQSKDTSNLLGTYRTLDGINGSVEIEQGILSKSSMTLIDDSNSLTFENGLLSTHNLDEFDLYLFGYLTDYEQCIKDYYKLTGNTPLLPKYVLGNWWSRYWNYKDEDLQELILSFKQHNIPLSICIIDMDWHITDVPKELGGGWTGYTWNTDYFKDPTSFISWLHDQGLHVSVNLHPADGIRSYESCYEDVCKTMKLQPKNHDIIPFDLTNPLFLEAYFKDVHHPLEQQDIDFWWIDWQQGTQSNIKNLDPLFALNHYHFYDGINRGKHPYFIFSRWSGLGGHRYPIGFSGDTIISWNSLQFQPYFTSTASNVGYGWWSHDIGGHYHGKETEELYIRWLQFGVFSPIMRLHSTKSFYHKREPWNWNKEIEYIATQYLQFRHKLIPYIHTFNHLNSNGNIPLIRPLYYKYPNIKAAYNHHNQYFFGTELMIKPFTSVLTKPLLLSKEKVWFKEDGWFQFFTGEYIKKRGTYTMYGSLRDTNVFAKSGAIIPLSTYPQKATEALPEELDIHVFPGDNNEFILYEDSQDQIYKTMFSLSSKHKTLTLDITSNQIQEHSRLFHIHFRNIRLDTKIMCTTDYFLHKDSSTSSIIISVDYDMIEQCSITLHNKQNLLTNPYNMTNDIMHRINQSELTSEEKNAIGYINFNNYKENRGWLGENNSLQAKMNQIKELKLPGSVKQYLKDTIQKEIKNSD